jgi:hypothetical protein
MKVKILKYIQRPLNGRMKIFDTNEIIDLSDNDAVEIIRDGHAIELGADSSVPSFENKMVDLVYKRKPGRPKKEV